MAPAEPGDGSPKNSAITIGGVLATPQMVEVYVADHGPGVSPERRNEIFELFARRAGDAGAGLGLTIAKTFVEAHGQRIWVEDDPAGGARFCFTLPVAASIPEEPKVAADSAGRASKPTMAVRRPRRLCLGVTRDWVGEGWRAHTARVASGGGDDGANVAWAGGQAGRRGVPGG
jgi:Histidine kinase-, DNA gyrase B-, and HSP90-like ATPase